MPRSKDDFQISFLAYLGGDKFRKLTSRVDTLWKRPEVRFPVRFAALSLLAVYLYQSLGWLQTLSQSLAIGMTKHGATLTGLQAQVVQGGVMSFDNGALWFDVTISCSALAVAMVYGAAVVAYPTTWRDRGIGLAAGVPFIFVLNGVRLVSLAWLGVLVPSLWENAHAFGWQAIFIIVVGVGWLAWVRFVVQTDGDGHLKRIREIGIVCGIFLAVFSLFWLVGSYAWGIHAYQWIVLTIASGPSRLIWGMPIGETTFGNLDEHVQFMYSLLAAITALFLATPRVHWKSRAIGAAAVCLPTILALNLAWLLAGLAAGTRITGASFLFYGVLEQNVVHASLPLFAWLVWAYRSRVFDPRTRRTPRSYTCPACGDVPDDILTHVRTAHKNKARQLRRELAEQHPELKSAD